MKHPDKWRETVDPFSLNYHDFRPLEILGYPHAGNDVFCAKGIYKNKEVRAYIKAARQKGPWIENEVSVLSSLKSDVFPEIIDYGFEGVPFSVSLELPGERLSNIVGENENLASIKYMREYGRKLAEFHQLTPQANVWPDRKFYHLPPDELLRKLDLEYLKNYFSNPPKESVRCFCHGDFHYANILWRNHHISAILDFEMAGYGSRDFDIAWALFTRPGQKFMKSEEELQEFLKGYGEIGEYDLCAIRFYMAQCYTWFLEFTKDKEYCEYARNRLNGIQKDRCF